MGLIIPLFILAGVAVFASSSKASVPPITRKNVNGTVVTIERRSDGSISVSATVNGKGGQLIYPNAALFQANAPTELPGEVMANDWLISNHGAWSA